MRARVCVYVCVCLYVCVYVCSCVRVCVCLCLLGLINLKPDEDEESADLHSAHSDAEDDSYKTPQCCQGKQVCIRLHLKKGLCMRSML